MVISRSTTGFFGSSDGLLASFASAWAGAGDGVGVITGLGADATGTAGLLSSDGAAGVVRVGAMTMGDGDPLAPVAPVAAGGGVAAATDGPDESVFAGPATLGVDMSAASGSIGMAG